MAAGSLFRNRGASLWLAALMAVAAGQALAGPAAEREPWRLDPDGAAGAAPGNGKHALGFNPADLDTWEPGESGALSLPHGRRLAIRGARIEQHPSGNRTWI